MSHKNQEKDTDHRHLPIDMRIVQEGQNILKGRIWTYETICASSKDLGQPVHPSSLITPSCPKEEVSGPVLCEEQSDWTISYWIHHALFAAEDSVWSGSTKFAQICLSLYIGLQR